MLLKGAEKNKNAFIVVLLIVVTGLLTAAGLSMQGTISDLETGEPVFSKDSGFYKDGFDLEIYCGSGQEIRYTLDSSEPSKDSVLYEGPIRIYDKSPEENLYAGNIYTSVDYYDYSRRKGYVLPGPVDKCTVVRAAAFENGEKVTDTVTKCFFIDYDEKPSYRGTPVISLVLDPDDLFGYENGIYVIGKKGTDDFLRRVENSEKAQDFLKENPDAPLDGSVKIGNVYMHEAYVYNYSQGGYDWERPGDISFFDSFKTKLLSGRLGVRIRGHNSRNFPQKSLSFFQRKEYSKKSFYYPYLKNNIDTDAALSGGGDDMYTFVRDPLMSRLFRKGGLKVGVQEFSAPVFLFLNGEFWGTYLLSEKEDAAYLNRHYGVDEDNVLIVKNGVAEDGREDKYAEVYGELVKYTAECDLSTKEGYEGFCSMVDIESLMDYYASRIYADDSSDWPKTNVSMWRSINRTDRPYEDGKWRFLNFDNNIELQKDKVDFDTIGAILSQGEEDYADLKKELKNANGNVSDLIGRNIYFERMLPYVLFTNEDFRREFRKRFTEIEDTVYLVPGAEKELDRVAGENRIPVVTGYGRWFGDRCSFKDFDEKVEEIREFLRNRRQYADLYMDRACGVE